jgi:hypothetical protein
VLHIDASEKDGLTIVSEPRSPAAEDESADATAKKGDLQLLRF